MKRKMLAMVLGASMVASVLSGCGGKKPETEAVTEAVTKAAETEAAATEAAETEAPTEAAGTEAGTEAETAAAETEAGTEAETVAAETEAGTEAETVAAATEEETEAADAEAAGTEAVTEAETGDVTEAADTEEVTEAAETEAGTEGVTEAETEEVTEEAETEEVTEAAETEEATEAATEAAETEAGTEEVTEAAETEEATEAATEAAETEAETEEATEAAETEEATEAATEAAETEAETEEATEAAETEEATEAATEAAETEAETEEATEAAETEEATEAATEAAEAEAETEEVTEAAETEEATEATTEAAESESETEEATEAPAADVEYTVSYLDETVEGTLDDIGINENEIVVLYDNDVHGGISNHEDYSGSADSLGYAGLAAVKEDVTAQAGAVTTVDLGDAIQGSVVCTESNGQDVMDLMAAVGYDICIPGNHEFDYGMEEFLSYAENSDADFLSCNFVDTETGDPVFDPYKVVPYEINGQEFKIGYVAMSTPETIAKSTPTYFQDEEGNYIYGFHADTPEDLYGIIQDAIDGALNDGADMIVALGHMGDVGVESDWSSLSVIANTEGIDVFLDGHAHSVIDSDFVVNKNGEEVLLSSTGTKLNNIGVLTIELNADGEAVVATNLVNELTEEELASDSYAEISGMVDEIEEQYAYLFVKVGSTDYDLVIYDPADPETRLVRTVETNMGDFLTDAYRIQSGADIAFLNGGSIRADISAGDIVYMDLITVMPWNSETGVIEVTGQQILDCLEMGAHLYPEECGGFIQTSGLTYSIDTTMPSSVNVNSDGEFVSVDGEYRVKDVMVGEEPLDLEKTYTLAINKYYSEEAGDGMTMFKGSKVISPAEGDDWVIDHDVVIDYLAALGDNIGDEYENPYGQGRITLITGETEEATEAQATVAEDTAEEADTSAEETEAGTEADSSAEETEAGTEADSSAEETEADTRLVTA